MSSGYTIAFFDSRFYKIYTQLYLYKLTRPLTILQKRKNLQ